MFEKVLSASDAGRIGRLVLPKACAEVSLTSPWLPFIHLCIVLLYISYVPKVVWKGTLKARLSSCPGFTETNMIVLWVYRVYIYIYFIHVPETK